MRNIELQFFFDADWYDSNDDRYDWIVTGTFTPEQPERSFNCLPEDATPYEHAEFEITNVALDGMEGEPTQADIDEQADAILQAAIDDAMEIE